MHSKNDNIEIMISDEADEVREELFDSLKKRYQKKLETKMRNSELSFIMFIYCIINVTK